ncbi:helix-turn-helix domain-containing protein [Desulfurobacterium crinifex]
MDNKTEIGKRIKELREYLGLSQKEFAEALGIHPLSVSRYELGKSNPSPSILKLIEDKFGVNSEWLKKGKGNPFKRQRDSDNFNFKFNKRWKEVKANLENSAEIIADLCLEIFTSKKQKEKLNIEALRAYLKNKVRKHLLNEVNRSLEEVLTILSCLENSPPFNEFKAK